MPLVELRQQQDLISQEAARLLLPVLLRAVEAELPAAGWVRLAAVLFPQLVGWRARSSTIAWLAARAVLPSADRPPAPPYELAWTVQALRSTVLPRPTWSPILGRDGKPPGWSPAKAAADGTARLVRHVEQAGRETTIAVSSASGGKGRWARVSDGSSPCAFCALMISRGPVYHGDARRSGGFQAHDHDRCVAVLVRTGDRDWPGREEFERYEQIYAESASGESDQLNAFRRAVEQRQ